MNDALRRVARQIYEAEARLHPPGLGASDAGAVVGALFGVGLLTVGAAVTGAWLFPKHRVVASSVGAGLVLGGFFLPRL